MFYKKQKTNKLKTTTLIFSKINKRAALGVIEWEEEAVKKEEGEAENVQKKKVRRRRM